MVATITPVGHGGRRVGWAASIGLHTVAAGAAAALLGAAAAWTGGLLGAPWGAAGLLLVALVAAAYALRDLLGVPVPVPERRRQVPEWWRAHFSPPVAAFLYGAGLGIGFLTYLRHGTLVAVSAAAFVGGDPALGALLVAPFGIARALALSAVGAARTSEDVGAVVARLERLGATPWPRAVNGVVLLTMAGAAGAVGGGATGDLGPGAAGAVGLALGWAAVAKILRPRAWRRTVTIHELGPLEGIAVVGVPTAEAAVPALVMLGRPAAACLVALVLLTAFSIATLRARRLHGAQVPCGCFGSGRSVDYRVALGRNVALAAAALLGLGAPSTGSLALGAPQGIELLPAGMAALGIALAVWAVTTSLQWLRRAGG